MRTLILPLLLLTLLAASAQPVSAAQPLVLSGNPQAPPIVWEKGDKLVGVGPEIVKGILDTLQVPYIIRESGNWEQVQQSARAGTIDMIVSAYDNTEREAYMAFSTPYLKSPVVIVVKRGRGFPFTSWKDLVGKRGVANVGESFGQAFDTFIKDKLDVTYVPYKKAFEMMDLETADYLIVDLYPAIVYSKLLNAENKVEFLETPATTQYFHLTISKKSPWLHLMPQINQALEEMKKKGEIKKLLKEQYQNWRATFLRRQKFFARSEQRAQQAQTSWNAGSRDRGLDTMMRFIDRDIRYMDGSNFSN